MTEPSTLASVGNPPRSGLPAEAQGTAPTGVYLEAVRAAGVTASPDAADAEDVVDPPDPWDDDLATPEGWDRPPAVNWLTRVLLTLLLVVVGLGTGVQLQKWRSSSSSSGAAAGGFPGGGSMPSGFPGGGSMPSGFPGGGSMPSGFPSGRNPGALPGGGAGSGGSGGAAGRGSPGTSSGSAPRATPDVPVVVGTIASVSPGALVVKNFAGTSVKVVVPDTATVTTKGLHQPTSGATVSISGSKRADGSVVATAVIVR